MISVRPVIIKWTQTVAYFALFLSLAATRSFAGDYSTSVSESESESSSEFDHFVPDSQRFWDFSKHWTTNYGPAYRDTVEGVSNFLPCTGRYALCFSSGPEPLPCTMDQSGRFANCKCTIEKGLNFVTISSILNYEVYLKTIAVCGKDGSKCATEIDKAPVCHYLRHGKLIPGAEIFSTFSPQLKNSHSDALSAEPAKSKITLCPKGPYVGCMTAPCQVKGKFAECSCPVFWGPFQLVRENAQCRLDDDHVWSASYSPALDTSTNPSSNQ